MMIVCKAIVYNILNVILNMIFIMILIFFFNYYDIDGLYLLITSYLRSIMSFILKIKGGLAIISFVMKILVKFQYKNLINNSASYKMYENYALNK